MLPDTFDTDPDTDPDADKGSSMAITKKRNYPGV